MPKKTSAAEPEQKSTNFSTILPLNTLKIDSTRDLCALFDEDDEEDVSYSPLKTQAPSKTISPPPQPATKSLPPPPQPSTAAIRPLSTKSSAPPKAATTKKTTQSIDHVTKCPSCNIVYTEKGANRRIVDSCGHGICVKCVVLSNSCNVCESEKTTRNNKFDDEDLESLADLMDSPESDFKPKATTTTTMNNQKYFK